MKNLLLTRKTLLVILTILISSLGNLALACPELQESGCGGGWAWFGLRTDGANVGQGQTVTLDCDAAIVSVEFTFRVTGNSMGGIPSLVAGDEIHLALMDTDENILYTVTTAVPADSYNDWLEFTFPEGFVTPAGQYRLAAYTNVERNASMGFCYGEGSDSYDGGVRSTSLNGIDGPWGGFIDGGDVPFRLHLDESSVATEEKSWGSIKGIYR